MVSGLGGEVETTAGVLILFFFLSVFFPSSFFPFPFFRGRCEARRHGGHKRQEQGRSFFFLFLSSPLPLFLIREFVCWFFFSAAAAAAWGVGRGRGCVVISQFIPTLFFFFLYEGG